jgi:hypothetical protein
LRRNGIAPLCARRCGMSPKNSHQCTQASAAPTLMTLASSTRVAASLVCLSAGRVIAGNVVFVGAVAVVVHV